jgi:MFS family permease
MSINQKDLRKKILIPCLIGNALEFYDFTLCGVFMVVLGKNFFPSGDDFAALIGGIFAFSAAFWTRPLGALVFGYIGDKYGRKRALTLSVLLMGIPTLIYWNFTNLCKYWNSCSLYFAWLSFNARFVYRRGI